MALQNTNNKKFTLKSKNKQHSRVRQSAVSSEQFSNNWDAIFKKKDKKTTEEK